MAVDGFNMEDFKNKKIEAISNDITSGANKVQNIGETVVDEYTLEMGLRPPTYDEAISQFEEQGYRVRNVEEKKWYSIGGDTRMDNDILVVDLYIPEEGIKKVCFKYNNYNNKFELLEEQESERALKMIEYLEEGLRSGLE